MNYGSGVSGSGRKLGFRSCGSRASRYFNSRLRYSIFLILAATIFAAGPMPVQATADLCTCVCNCEPRFGLVSIDNTTPEGCASYCNIPGCTGGTCGGEPVELPAPAAEPDIPDTGEAAVRGRLRSIGQSVTGEEAPPPSFAAYAGRIVRAALVLVGAVFFVLTIYGGILMLTAGGNEEQVKKSKTILVRAVSGLIIVIFAGAITQFITGYLARSVAPPQEGDAEQRDTSALCWWGLSCDTGEEE